MRHAICRVALATALAIFLIGSSGTARADDSAWKAAYDTDPHLPLTPEQVEMTAEKRAAEPQGGDVILAPSLDPSVVCASCSGGGYPQLCAPGRESDVAGDELLLRPGVRYTKPSAPSVSRCLRLPPRRSSTPRSGGPRGRAAGPRHPDIRSRTCSTGTRAGTTTCRSPSRTRPRTRSARSRAI